jgi:protein gp37
MEDQTRADERIPDLLATPAAIRFISAEPLLGPIDLERIVIKAAEHPDRGQPPVSIKALTGWMGGTDQDRTRIDWVIAGGESGPDARPMHPDWARSLRDQCAAAGVAFHFKQWGEWAPSENCTLDCTADALIFDATAGTWRKSVDGGWIGDQAMCRVGKKRAGRLLDGVEHNGFPSQVNGEG